MMPPINQLHDKHYSNVSILEFIGGQEPILLRQVASKKIFSKESFLAYLTHQCLALVVVLMSPTASILVT
jgi:hypothetical protein